ncbi:MAG: hypothetical protein ABIB98_02885 [bacterium]
MLEERKMVENVVRGRLKVALQESAKTVVGSLVLELIKSAGDRDYPLAEIVLLLGIFEYVESPLAEPAANIAWLMILSFYRELQNSS